MLPRIIAFAGKSRSGKDTLSSVLIEMGYIHLKIADELKNLVCDLLSVSRENLEKTKDLKKEIRLSSSDLYIISKETTVPLNSLQELETKIFSSPRELLQYLGTDIIRRYVPDWHIRRFLDKIKPNEKYVNSDIRFKDEVEAVKNLDNNSKIIYIQREMKNNPVSNTLHESETGLDETTQGIDYCINNNGTLDDLYNKLEDILKNHMTSQELDQ
jgi:midasin (ATPase involved in ribosome maturation)